MGGFNQVNMTRRRKAFELGLKHGTNLRNVPGIYRNAKLRDLYARGQAAGARMPDAGQRRRR